MKLTEMRPQPETNTNLSSANFFSWKDAGSMGVPVRPFGEFVRRYIHFVNITKEDGTKIITPIPCINFNYEASEVIPNPNDCPLDEVYEAQLEGKTHTDLPFVSFPLPPDSWGKDAKIQRASFSASVNAINRAKQNGATDSECIEIVSFKKTAFEKVLLLAGVGGNPQFSMGDPTDEETGYDLLCMYHADRPGIQRYELQAGRQSTPVTAEEKTVLDEAVNLEEYYKVLTRDEIIEKLTKIYEGESFSTDSLSDEKGTVTPSVTKADMMKQADDSLSFN
jgi:hypothetical protein